MNFVVSFWRCFLVVGVLLLLSIIASADNGRGLHKKAYAVPVPAGKKVKIDGKLNDWDLSGQIRSYVVSETADTQGAQFAMMYDKDALYLSGVVADTSPMMNRNDPKVNGNKGWDADACQFRMVLDATQGYPVNQSTWQPVDNDQMAHLILWYYTDRKEPCLQLHKGMTYKPIAGTEPFGVLPRDKFQAVYLPNKNDREYTFEYRIPWKSLETKNIPKAGDLVAGTVQFNWGTNDGLKTAGGSAWCYDVMSGPGFTFQSSACWGKIIFSKTGNLAKELVEDGLPPEKPLPLKFEYNVPEDSQVSVQLFNEKNEMVRTIVAQGDRRGGKMIDRWDGLDEIGKPLPAGTYQWKGLYHQPITTKFLFSAHNSGQPPYPTDDNKGGWGGDHGTPTTACALPDGMLLAWNSCELGWGIIRTDLSGKKQWGSKHCSRYLATDGKRFFGSGDEGFEQHAGVAVYDATDSRPLNFGNGKPIAELPAGGDDKTNSVTGIAYADGKLYVALNARNMIAVNDAATGTIKETINIDNPGSLAIAKDGILLVVSGDTILNFKNGKSDTFIKEKIDKPFAVTTDVEGNIYISNRGNLQNISVFSADGKYLRSIGKTGGRPAKGKYEKDGMLEPGGLSVDTKGNIWVAETPDSPKRFSVWNSKDGSLANEFFGGSAYFGWLWMDPKHPDEIYCHNTVWKVDWTKNSCYPISTMWRSTKPNMIGNVSADGYAGHVRVMTAKNGKQFAWGMRDYSNMLYMRSGDVFKPIAGIIRVAFGAFGGGMPYPAMKDIYEKTKAGAFLWQDANDDQEVQPDELAISPSGRGETAFNWIDADLNAWCDAGWIYKPTKITDEGRPIYDFNQKTDIPFKGSNANATSLWLDDKDDTVYTLNPGSNPGLARWTRDGKMLWGYPNILPWPSSLNLPMVTPGKLHGLTMPLCVAGDFTGAVTYYNPYHILTRDGLYVAMITRDGRDGKGLGPDVIATESVQGQLVKPEGMNRYFLLAGAQDGRVTEIFGLDTVKRLPGGTYIHTEEDVKLTMQAQLDYQKALSNTKKLEIVRGLKSLESASSVEKFVDATRSFSVKTAYDDKNLYVSYDVSSQFALINAETDLRVIFKAGNLIDIQIATDPMADAKRKTPAPGDLRILVSRQAGKTVAVIYRPKIKGFTGTPVVLSSPTGKESFDAIDISDKIICNYKPKNGGFEAFVTIPLETIGWSPQPSTQVKIDFGYIFGNATGTQASLRAYWTNNSSTSNILKDVPSECRLEPAEWGIARVE